LIPRSSFVDSGGLRLESEFLIARSARASAGK
jgi:hypothetical protein